MSYWVRQFHRWVSIAFTATVIANSIALALNGPAASALRDHSPLFPLFLLMFTGLYLFALPYVARRRGARRAG